MTSTEPGPGTTPAERPAHWARISRWITGAFGAGFLLLATWASVDASAFARTVANFGPYNPHLVRDFAAYSATCGAGLLICVQKSSWRVPVLALATMWNALHSLSHLVDSSAAEPAYVGPLEFVLLLVAAVALGLCALIERRQAARRPELPPTS